MTWFYDFLMGDSNILQLKSTNMHCEWICSIVTSLQLWQKNSFALLQIWHFLFTSNVLPHFRHESILIVSIDSFWYIILGKLISLPVFWVVYHTLSSSTIYYNHENTNNSNQHLGQNGPRPIQKSRNIWPYLHGTWNHDGHRNRCILGCRSINSSTYFFILHYNDII